MNLHGAFKIIWIKMVVQVVMVNIYKFKDMNYASFRSVSPLPALSLSLPPHAHTPHHTTLRTSICGVHLCGHFLCHFNQAFFESCKLVYHKISHTVNRKLRGWFPIDSRYTKKIALGISGGEQVLLEFVSGHTTFNQSDVLKDVI